MGLSATLPVLLPARTATVQEPSFLFWPVCLVTSPWMCGWRAQGTFLCTLHTVRITVPKCRGAEPVLLNTPRVATSPLRGRGGLSIIPCTEPWRRPEVHLNTKTECSWKSCEGLRPWVGQLCAAPFSGLWLHAQSRPTIISSNVRPDWSLLKPVTIWWLFQRPLHEMCWSESSF